MFRQNPDFRFLLSVGTSKLNVDLMKFSQILKPEEGLRTEFRVPAFR